jgi:hypothetical protein
MTHDPDRRLELRLVSAERPADPQVLDDLIRLIRQGLATAPRQVPQVSDGTWFRRPTEEERKDLVEHESRIKHRIEQEPDSHDTLAKRSELTAQPDHEQKLAEETRRAAEYVVAAVQRALNRGVAVRIPESSG